MTAWFYELGWIVPHSEVPTQNDTKQALKTNSMAAYGVQITECKSFG